MKQEKTTFAVFYGNRGFFPASLQASARKEMSAALKKLGYGSLTLGVTATRHGAVETAKEAEVYARFLDDNRGKYDGVILCLPNFGDETGAVAALKDAGVPILVQAFPDELNKMGPAFRRDSFCGKFSIMNVFTQYGVPFTVLPPHTVHPGSKEFADNLDYFARLCRVVNGMQKLRVGAIGARTTPFKTVRFDELALQKHGITVETMDLSEIFDRMKKIKDSDRKLKKKQEVLREIASWKKAPAEAFAKIARLGVVLDDVIAEFDLHALGVRCWTEMQSICGISPCVVMGELNERGIPAACEVDVNNAVTMFALSRASNGVSACLDWNNNYGTDEEKCVLFHCGPVPRSMMAGKGEIVDHAILMSAVGAGNAFGCNAGRIKPMAMTFGSMLTRDGKLEFYLGEGRFTNDPVAPDFFGCAGVLEVEGLQTVIQTIGYLGHRHHVSVAPGHVMQPALDALEHYLGFDVTVV